MSGQEGLTEPERIALVEAAAAQAELLETVRRRKEAAVVDSMGICKTLYLEALSKLKCSSTGHE